MFATVRPSGGRPAATDRRDTLMTTETYTVDGITCDHCVRAIKGEVGAIDGVTSVDVDVPTGRVTVVATAPVPAERVREAVEVAGYALAQ